MGYYRFLQNKQVKRSELLESIRASCQAQVSGRVVLSVSDTSEINLQRHSGRLKQEGVGVVGNNRDLGFWLHPSLVLDAKSGFPLGLSHIRSWHRSMERSTKEERNYKYQAIEEKESYKWLDAANKSQHCLKRGGSIQVTHIGDREADIYEEWATVPSPDNHLLIRACRDRKLANGSSLYETLSQQPVGGTYDFELTPDPRRYKERREVSIAVRWAQVRIQRPQRLKRSAYPEHLSLYALDVCEVEPPTGVSPVHWRLLTTHPVTNLGQALLLIRWYNWRWRIEQLFFTLKSGGFELESSQLESVDAIERLSYLTLAAALQVLQLHQAVRDETQPATLVFSTEELRFLRQLAPKFDGRTPKQRNPFPESTLAWATWLIARLAGWSGFRSQRPPGVITLSKGLQRFYSCFLGWSLAP